MHSAVAVTTMWTWVSLPRPASLPSTSRVLPLGVALHDTKCGLPAQAPVAARTPTRAMPTRIDRIRRCMVTLLLEKGRYRGHSGPIGYAHTMRHPIRRMVPSCYVCLPAHQPHDSLYTRGDICVTATVTATTVTGA